MADVSYLDEYGGLEIDHDRGRGPWTDRNQKMRTRSPSTRQEVQAPAAPHSKHKATATHDQVPFQPFLRAIDVLGAPLPPPSRPRPAVQHHENPRQRLPTTSIPPETEGGFEPLPKEPPLIRLTRVSKQRTRHARQSFAHKLRAPSDDDDRQEQQPLEFVMNPLRFRARNNFTTLFDSRNQPQSKSLSGPFDPWLVRIKEVHEIESSEMGDVYPEKVMDNTKSITLRYRILEAALANRDNEGDFQT